MPRPPEQDEAVRDINREVSWLDYDARVLGLAAEKHVPLLERVKYCAIFSHMLDEFFTRGGPEAAPREATRIRAIGGCAGRCCSGTAPAWPEPG